MGLFIFYATIVVGVFLVYIGFRTLLSCSRNPSPKFENSDKRFEEIKKEKTHKFVF